jgi:hypothetical protein
VAELSSKEAHLFGQLLQDLKAEIKRPSLSHHIKNQKI